jgi:hypothetical protein
MLSEIGSWRRHENSVRFVGSKPLERRADMPIFSHSGHQQTLRRYCGSIRVGHLSSLGVYTVKWIEMTFSKGGGR